MRAGRLLVAVAAATALHGLLGWLASMRPMPAPPAQPSAVRMTVVDSPRATEPPRASGPPRAEGLSKALRAARATVAGNARPSSTPPSTVDSAAEVSVPATTTTAAEPAQAASQPSRPLDLAWRRGMTAGTDERNPALDDARAVTARATPEDHMGRRMSQVVHEELRQDGSVRITRGDDCVDLRASRSSQLFASEGSTRPLPRLASPCP